MKIVPNQVVFDPHIGGCYSPGGKTRFGSRLLLVGASHYCEHYCYKTGCGKECPKFGKYKTAAGFYGRRCEKFTEVTLEIYLKKADGPSRSRWFSTFDTMFRLFVTSGQLNAESRKNVLDNIAYMEYCEEAESCNPYHANPEVFFDVRNFNEFKRIVSELRPQYVVTFGARVRNSIGKNLGCDAKAGFYETTIDEIPMTMIHLRHPSDRFNRGKSPIGTVAESGIKQLLGRSD